MKYKFTDKFYQWGKLVADVKDVDNIPWLITAAAAVQKTGQKAFSNPEAFRKWFTIRQMADVATQTLKKRGEREYTALTLSSGYIIFAEEEGYQDPDAWLCCFLMTVFERMWGQIKDRLVSACLDFANAWAGVQSAKTLHEYAGEALPSPDDSSQGFVMGKVVDRYLALFLPADENVPVSAMEAFEALEF